MGLNLVTVQLGFVKKVQATPSSQRKGILLAVDLQNGFLSTPECKAVVSKVVAHANQFHQVWATRFFNRNANFSRQLGWNKMVSGEETELCKTLSPIVSKIFDKPSYSPHSPAIPWIDKWRPPLLQALQKEAITTVAVCGVDTEACVMATALGLFDTGFETFVVSDGCASNGGQEYHEAGIKILKRNIGAEYVVSFRDLPLLQLFSGK
jgi:nicotinamidase-related amidase